MNAVAAVTATVAHKQRLKFSLYPLFNGLRISISKIKC